MALDQSCGVLTAVACAVAFQASAYCRLGRESPGAVQTGG
jgi:hypothetical protein